MINSFSLGMIFLVLAAVGVILRKTYFELPVREIRKRRALGDQSAAKLNKALVNPAALRSFLWLYLGVTLAVSLTLLAKSLPIWLSCLVFGLILYLFFSLLPRIKVNKFDSWLTELVNPILVWLTVHTWNYLNPVYRYLAKPYTHSRSVFDEQDLIEFLQAAAEQPGSRLTPELLQTLKRNLAFNKLTVEDVMIPSKEVKTVLERDIIGPILINDLHENGQDHIFVKTESRGPISGLLAFKDLGIRSEGRVADLMSRSVSYVNQTDSILSVLKAYFVTKQTMFAVIDQKQKFKGSVSLDQVLTRLLGDLNVISPVDYDDPEAVSGNA